MLLALDAGNTNVTIGAYEGETLRHRWRLRTIREQTADEWGILLRNLFALDDVRLEAIQGVIISSVVPPLDSTLAAMTRHYFHTDALFVTPGTDTGLTIRYENPREVGADRIVNSVAALHKYGGPCVIVDLGTAITFDAVSAQAEYLGGIICPGIGMSVAGLFNNTARLPLVDFQAPEKLIGTNTVGSMQSGLYYGIVSMIDGILKRLLTEVGVHTHTIATGGQASLIAKGSRYLQHIDEDLTLDGLRLIWQRQQGL